MAVLLVSLKAKAVAQLPDQLVPEQENTEVIIFIFLNTLKKKKTFRGRCLAVFKAPSGMPFCFITVPGFNSGPVYISNSALGNNSDDSSDLVPTANIGDLG